MAKKIKLTLKQLKETIQGARKTNLKEAYIRLSDNSVDDQIDSLLIGFEKDSSTNKELETEYESINFKHLKLKNLFEAPDEKGGNVTAKDLGLNDETDNAVKTSKDIEQERPSKPDIPPIDVSKFANKVARLIINRDNLLDVKTVIFNRGKNFLKKNYGDEVANKYEEILMQEHGIEQEKEYHQKIAPNYAVGAGPSIG